jgi:hypothetical protein
MGGPVTTAERKYIVDIVGDLPTIFLKLTSALLFVMGWA